MLQTFIHDNWRMRRAGDKNWMKAVVPGSVYNDLLLNHQMEDPYYRDNELKAFELMNNDYEYCTTFSVDAAYFQMDEVYLWFEGLDTLADIWLNGERLSSKVNENGLSDKYSAYNMHRQWEFAVKNLLKPENNELKIRFYSPLQYIKQEDAKDHWGGTKDATVGFPHLRKPHYMFGWDWGPRIPDAGIWRPVSLLGILSARIRDVYVWQEHKNGKVKLKIDTNVQRSESKAQSGCCSIMVTVRDPLGHIVADCHISEKLSHLLEITNPQLWWPNGYGDQPLYTVRVELFSEGVCLDVWEKRIGLRTMTMCTEKDEYGECFAHEINGVKIFAMGADYIPEDNILSRMNPQRTRELMEQCVAANFNSIRVWGGGCYPEDYFYDICDELGLVIWQDFMFACANYRLTEEFEENITAEIVENIRRLRHHASLGLWCGNNEMEMFADRMHYDGTVSLRAEYTKINEYLIPKLVKKEDPQAFYWPSSPSSGGGFDQPTDPNRGDAHYWALWSGTKPFTEYRKHYFRYLSEFGFQSFPAMKTIETYTEPEDRNVYSYVMEKHQRMSAGTSRIMNAMGQSFLFPKDLDTLVYASQLVQAEAIRYGVEHFRRYRGRCMGTVYWQLNDCWPVASWASIDYYGRWKALHYAAKRFFAPLLLSCEEEGMLSQSVHVNTQPRPIRKAVRFNVCNETMSERRVLVKWQLRDADAGILKSWEEQVCVDALSARWLDSVELEDASLYENYVSYQLVEDGQEISSGSALFCPPKHYKFRNPKLTVRREQDELVVTATAYARGVEIRNENEDLILSDNYFDMNGGEKRVKILKGKPAGLTVRSVYDVR